MQWKEREKSFIGGARSMVVKAISYIEEHRKKN